MKSTTRRNVASLVFIGVLAVVYVAIILLTSRETEGGEVVENKQSPIVTATDSIASTDSTTTATKTVDIENASKRKKSSSKKKQKDKTPPAPDRADVFDRPVDKIER